LFKIKEKNMRVILFSSFLDGARKEAKVPLYGMPLHYKLGCGKLLPKFPPASLKIMWRAGNACDESRSLNPR
jgi:hypothetical protein